MQPLRALKAVVAVSHGFFMYGAIAILAALGLYRARHPRTVASAEG